MTAQSRATLYNYFAANARPSAAQFVDLVDSFALVGAGAGSNALSKASAATGLIYASAQTGSAQAAEIGAGALAFVSAATTAARVAQLGAGAVGSAMFNTATTAAAQQQLGGGAVGREVFGAAATASAQTQLGGGVAGRGVFEAVTTASAVSLLGGSSTDARATAATTAQASGGTNTSAKLTPGISRFLPWSPKAWAHINMTGIGAANTKASIRQAYNVSTVSGGGAGGRVRINFGSAFPTRNYAVFATPQQSVNHQTNPFVAFVPGSAGSQGTTECQIVVMGTSGAGSAMNTSALFFMAMDR